VKTAVEQSIEDDSERFDQTLADELEQVSYYSTGDTVEVVVKSVNYDGSETATLTFEPPIGDSFTFEWDVPRYRDHQTMFTAALNTSGHNLTTAQQLVGERLEFYYDDGEWEPSFDIPEPPVQEKVKNNIREFNIESFLELSSITTFLVLLPLFSPIVLIGSIFWSGGEDTEDIGFGETAFALIVLNVIWVILATVIAHTILPFIV